MITNRIFSCIFVIIWRLNGLHIGERKNPDFMRISGYSATLPDTQKYVFFRVQVLVSTPDVRVQVPPRAPSKVPEI